MRRYSLTAQVAHYFESIVSKKGESYRSYLKTIQNISSDTTLSDEDQGLALLDTSWDSPIVQVIEAISPQGTDTFEGLLDIVRTSELFMASQAEAEAEA
jgi:hypothetical protein